MVVRDAMTQAVQTVSPQATLLEASRMLAELDIGGLPVVDDSGRVVGIISESDIIHHGSKRTSLDNWIELESIIRTRQPKARDLSQEINERLDNPVADVMTVRVITVTPDTTLQKAARLMVEHRINRLPVLDGQRLVGIITRGDVLKEMYRAQTAR